MGEFRSRNGWKNGVRYGLFQHLKKCCENMHEFAPLLNTFALDSIDFGKLLEVSTVQYPHYSLHDATHSASILANIEQFLGEERIEQLTPTDAWLILMAVYMHDIGMPYTREEMEKLDTDEDFLHFCITQKTDPISGMRDAADFVLTENQQLKTLEQIAADSKFGDRSKTMSSIFEAEFYMRQLRAEYFRKRHNETAFNVIKHRLDQFMHRNIIPKRLVLLYATCAMAHGVSFEKLKAGHRQETNGFRNDCAHPRFVAMLLRLGDLFDADNNRFNRYLVELSGGMPESSEAHYQKHMAISHILITPEKFEISADLTDCSNNDVVQLKRTFDNTCLWFDWIDDEIKKLNTEWFDIVPPGFTGTPPRLTERKIYFHDKSIERDQIAVRYRIDYQRAFDYMQGENLYTGELVFCRELVQNAFDATKRQFYRNMSRFFTLDSMEKALEEASGDRKDSGRKSQRKLDVGDSLDPMYWLAAMLYELHVGANKYDVKLEILNAPQFSEKGKRYQKSGTKSFSQFDKIRFLVDDNGIGINHQAIKRMQTVGEEPIKEDRREVKNMPGWLRPTGEFGIGMHSVFAFSNHFHVSTITAGHYHGSATTANAYEKHRLRGDSRNEGGRLFDYPEWIQWEPSYNEIERDSHGTTIITDIDSNKLLDSLRPLDCPIGNDASRDIMAHRIYETIQKMLSANIFPLKICINLPIIPVGGAPMPFNNRLSQVIPSLFQCLVDNVPKWIDPSRASVSGSASAFCGDGESIDISAIRAIKRRLDQERIEGCVVWEFPPSQARDTAENAESGSYAILSIHSNNHVEADEKNIILQVRFLPLTKTIELKNRVSFKGSYITDTRRQTELPYLENTLHILGRNARSTITVSRDYLLPNSLPAIRKDMNHALDALIVYLARKTGDDLKKLLLNANQGTASLILYFWRWIWSTNALYRDNPDVERAVRELQRKLLSASDLGETMGYVVEDGEIKSERISHKDILENPLGFSYYASIIMDGSAKLLDIAVTPGSPDGLRILPDILSRMNPNISMKSICLLNFEKDRSPVHLFAFQYGIGQESCVEICSGGSHHGNAEITEQAGKQKEKLLLKYLSQLKRDGRESKRYYIPCLACYKELGVRLFDQAAVEKWPLCRAFIQIPYFGVDDERVWECWLKEIDEDPAKKPNGIVMEQYIKPCINEIFARQVYENRYSYEEIQATFFRFVRDWNCCERS